MNSSALLSRKHLFAMALVHSTLVSACTVHAGVIGTASIVAPPFLAPDAALTLSGFTAYQLDISTDDGALIQAIDVNINGLLHQRWGPDNDFDGNPDPTPLGPPSNRRGDSHLTLIAGALIGSAPVENNNVSPSPLPDGAFDYGVGSFLRGAWGIPGASQTTSANLAYIVIPYVSVSAFDIYVEVATSSGTYALGRDTFYPPEPASVVLLVLGSLLVLTPSRRNNLQISPRA